jgi:protein subunit release factor B
MNKTLLFSLTKKDFEMTVFRCPGKGGQKVNKTSSGVRFYHPASGATGKACDERMQSQNKKLAFERLLATKEFKVWHKAEVARRLGWVKEMEALAEDSVERMMNPKNLKVEYL